MLCLEGVSKQDLDNCLDYMYNGEVQIFQDDLDRFLNVAQRYKIKGLLHDGKKVKDETFDVGAEQIDQLYSIKEELVSNPQPMKRSPSNQPRIQNVVSINESSNSLEQMKTETEKYNEFMEDGHVKCTVCGKQSSEDVKRFRLRNMRKHVEIHMEGLSYSCPMCDKTFRSKNALSCHKYVYHKK